MIEFKKFKLIPKTSKKTKVTNFTIKREQSNWFELPSESKIKTAKQD